MTRRVLIGFLTVTVLVLALLEIPSGVFYAKRELERYTADVERDASVIATVYEDDSEANRTLDPRPAQEYAARTGARVVVTDAHGIAAVDTAGTVPRDFSTRPEFAVALRGARASGRRRSDTLDAEIVYVTVPVSSGGIVHGALRVSVGTADVDARIHRYWLGLGGIASVVLASMALVGWAIARSVTRPVRQLTETASRYAGGDLRVADARTGLRDAPAELRLLSDTMATMAERVSALLDEQAALVADASHQLRTPLTALRLRLENLQANLPDQDAARLDAPIEETARLGVLVADLLQLARAEAHAPPVTVDLDLVTRERADTWSAVADARDVLLDVHGSLTPMLVRAVPGAIEQILDNVLDNALHAAPAGTRIDVSVVRGVDRHRLTISDQGPGLSAEERDRARRRFWRGSNARPGTGLGLAIADSLANASGGSLQLEAAPTTGLRVILELPAAAGEQAKRPSADQPQSNHD